MAPLRATLLLEGIAFQSDILALNAAIEAARGGEGGREVALAAAELRALAQELRALDGSDLAAGPTAQRIVASVQRLTQMVDRAGDAPAAAAVTSLKEQAERLAELLAV
jgi:hypothetical protein